MLGWSLRAAPMWLWETQRVLAADLQRSGRAMSRSGWSMHAKPSRCQGERSMAKAGTLDADFHHAPLAAGSLGGEDHQMSLQRFIGARQDRARVVVGQRCDKVAHDAEVAAAVTALDRTVG